MNQTTSLKFLLCVAAFGAASLISHAAEPALTLKKDDVWVMAGDSITAQRMHTNYIEAFCRTRFPNLNLHFRNSGIGGNRTAISSRALNTTSRRASRCRCGSRFKRRSSRLRTMKNILALSSA